jgi:hypothetical protein
MRGATPPCRHDFGVITVAGPAVCARCGYGERAALPPKHPELPGMSPRDAKAKKRPSRRLKPDEDMRGFFMEA